MDPHKITENDRPTGIGSGKPVLQLPAETETAKRLAQQIRFILEVDRLKEVFRQPMLLNCHTEGAAWRRHGVTRDRVVARNSHVAEGSTELWNYVGGMIAEAVAAGHLQDA